MKRQRSDLNQQALVKIARQMGCSVLVLSRTEHIDLLVGCNGIDQLVELKNSDHPPSKRTLSDDERKFQDEWCGRTPVIVENANGMINLVTWMRKRPTE